ncbi:MqnA/MqnD/SBP family protein [Clostridium sp. E02]|uniref:ABC transporter substrate-binding protein n=1 Tax=Clostridium sp. E02 TaxID=2487134 RepID=UPI000F526E7E|nr:MqnA/MqnD/SBP family protein [Clostridium sp. E02]
MKKVLSIFAVLVMTAAVLTGCGKDSTQTTAESQVETPTEPAAETQAASTEESKAKPANDSDALKVGSLKGPTSMGLVRLMEQAENGQSQGSYEFTMVTAPDELLGKIVNGDLDVALVPANMASILSNHGVTVININTLGVLYGISSDDSIKSMADLKGKTIYLPGKGTTPDYALKHVLAANGLSEDDVTLEYKSEPAEVAAILKEKPDGIGLLPQPFVTAAMAQNDSLHMVLDLTKEWNAVSKEDGSTLVTGVTICRNEVLKDHKDSIDTFLSEQKESAAYANENGKETAILIAKAGIIAKAPIAEKALPYCSITYLDGNDMKSLLSGYLKVLYDMDPQTIGGTLPDEQFYYIP